MDTPVKKTPLLNLISYMVLTIFLIVGIHYYLNVETTSETKIEAEEVPLSPNIIRFETEHIPTVMPHEHDVGDLVSHAGHHYFLKSDTKTLEENVWVTDISFTLHNAPASVLHHSHLIQLNKFSNTCPFRRAKEVGALAEDILHNDEITFPEPYGLFFEKGSVLELQAMLHNPTPPVGVGGVFEDVYLSIDLTYEPVASTSRTQPLEFYLMHLAEDSCGDGMDTFTIPANTTSFTYRQNEEHYVKPGQVTLPKSGEIVYAGGHLHGWEGGQELRVFKNEEVLETYQTYPSPTEKYVWETEHSNESIETEAGDVISIEAVYNNPNDVDITGAMGIYGFYFAPEVE